MANTYLNIYAVQLEYTRIEVVAAAVSRADDLATTGQLDVYDCHRFLYVSSGELRVRAGERDVRIGAGSLCRIPVGVPHRIETAGSSPSIVKWCHYRTSNGDQQLFRTLRLPLAVSVADREAAERILNRIISLVWCEAISAKVKLKASIFELAGLYLDNLPPGLEVLPISQELEKIDTVLRYIDERLADNITVEELAGLIYLHPNYFIGFFKSMLGCSPIQYVNQRRIQKAKELLLACEDSVSDISAKVGMKNYYFSRMFKSQTGLSPRKYRSLVGRRKSGEQEGEETRQDE